MPIQITVLYDNHCDNCHLQEGWGFSALVKYEGMQILFDTGGDYDAFISNANKLQLSYHEISHLMFSHRHWDHVAGFKEIIKKIPEGTPLYVPRTFPWSLRRNAASCLKTNIIDSFQEIAPNIYSLVLRGGFFLYEQVLIVKTAKGLCIITGCAHPGIVNIIKEAQKHLSAPIFFVMGGFHLLKKSEQYCRDVVHQFQALGVQNVGPCHCSGEYLIEEFQKAYGSNFFKIGTGTTLSL